MPPPVNSAPEVLGLATADVRPTANDEQADRI